MGRHINTLQARLEGLDFYPLGNELSLKDFEQEWYD